MDMVVLPRVAGDCSADEALRALRAAGRSALLTTGAAGEVRLFDLPHLLAEIRAGHKRLADMGGGQLVSLATEPKVAPRLSGRRAVAELPGRIQKILDTLGLSFLLFPTLEAGLPGLGTILTATLPLKTGRRNPARVRDAALLLTRVGGFAEAIAGRPPTGAPPFAFAVVATRFEDIADQHSQAPSWCTCDKDKSHKYEHSRYRSGDRCPQHDGGKLDCG